MILTLHPKFTSPNPQNITLFGNSHYRYNLLRWGHTGIVWIPNLIKLYTCKKGKLGHKYRHREKSCENEGRVQGDSPKGQRMTKIARKLSEARQV